MKRTIQSAIKLVGFDVNGTILDDRDAFLEALNAIFDHFKKSRLSPWELRRRFTQPWTRIYRDAGITEEEASGASLYELYNAAYQAQPKPDCAPGVSDALRWLYANNIPAVIVSTQQNEITHPLLAHHGLQQYFAEIIGGVHDKAEALKNLISRRGVAPEEAIYIGDQDSDVVYALQAGCIPVAYTQGVHSKTQLAEAGAKIFLDHFRDLSNLELA